MIPLNLTHEQALNLAQTPSGVNWDPSPLHTWVSHLAQPNQELMIICHSWTQLREDQLQYHLSLLKHEGLNL
jgi:hypothetical protein